LPKHAPPILFPLIRGKKPRRLTILPFFSPPDKRPFPERNSPFAKKPGRSRPISLQIQDFFFVGLFSLLFAYVFATFFGLFRPPPTGGLGAFLFELNFSPFPRVSSSFFGDWLIRFSGAPPRLSPFAPLSALALRPPL
jgi:hypothetical protein